MTKVLMQVTTVKLFKFYKNLGYLFAIHSNKKTIRKEAQIPGEMKKMNYTVTCVVSILLVAT